jgi:hypothetical protein
MTALHVNISTSGWQPPLLTEESHNPNPNRRSWLPRRKRARAMAALVIVSYSVLGWLALHPHEPRPSFLQYSPSPSLAVGPALYEWIGFHRYAPKSALG